MPMGAVIDVCGMLLGCLLGSRLGERFSEQLKHRLTAIFGFCALTIGVSLIVKIGSIAPVVLSLILGTLLGEFFYLEDRTNAAVCKASEKLLGSTRGEDYLSDFRAVAVLFCFSGPGLVGSLLEGFSGDRSLLLAKAVMDFFTAVIFSSRLGILLAVISIPQLTVLVSLFLLSHLLMPLFDAGMMANFYAVGGAITLMAGFNILKLKDAHVINTLPALILVPVVTACWPF